MSQTFRYNLDNVREECLADVSYYQNCSYEQLMQIGIQMYLKLDQCLTDLMSLRVNSGKYFDKKAQVEWWNNATQTLEKYFTSSVPYWAYEEYQERVEEALKA